MYLRSALNRYQLAPTIVTLFRKEVHETSVKPFNFFFLQHRNFVNDFF